MLSPAQQILQSNQVLKKPWPPSSPKQELQSFNPPQTQPNPSFPASICLNPISLCVQRGGKSLTCKYCFSSSLRIENFEQQHGFSTIHHRLHPLLHHAGTQKCTTWPDLGMQRCLGCHIGHAHIHFSYLPWLPNIHVKYLHPNHPAAAVLKYRHSTHLWPFLGAEIHTHLQHWVTC